MNITFGSLDKILTGTGAPLEVDSLKTFIQPGSSEIAAEKKSGFMEEVPRFLRRLKQEEYVKGITFIKPKFDFIKEVHYPRSSLFSHDGDSRIVCKVELDTERSYILKIFGCDNSTAKSLASLEALTMSRANGFGNVAGIPRCYGISGLDNGLVSLAIEVKNGKPLSEVIDDNYASLTEKDKLTICCNVLNANRDMHANDIIHRDGKPANVIVYGNNVSYIDFEMGCLQEDGGNLEAINGRYVGTVDYLGPSFLVDDQIERERRMRSPEIDEYVATFVIFEVLTGEIFRSPFRNKPYVEIRDCTNSSYQRDALYRKFPSLFDYWCDSLSIDPQKHQEGYLRLGQEIDRLRTRLF